MEPTETLLRFTITFLFALVFGIERQKSHKPIGFGTFIFVSIGSCGLAITALSLTQGNPNENPVPLLSAIVTGIGFLGAGALIKTTDRIFGFTTAASVWFFAIFGLIIGVGEYATGLLMYALAWVVISYDRYLERKGVELYQRKVTVSANNMFNEPDIRKHLGAIKCKLISIHIDKKDNKLHATYLVEGFKEDIEGIPRRLHSQEWFDHCKIE